jgi:hypothetical protein
MYTREVCWTVTSNPNTSSSPNVTPNNDRKTLEQEKGEYFKFRVLQSHSKYEDVVEV